MSALIRPTEKFQKLLSYAGLALVLLSGAILLINAQRLFRFYDTSYDFLLLKPPFEFGEISPKVFEYQAKVQGVIDAVQSQERHFRNMILLSMFLLGVGFVIGATGFLLRRRIRTGLAI